MHPGSSLQIDLNSFHSTFANIHLIFTSIFTPQPLRLWGIVITRGGRAGEWSEIQLLQKWLFSRYY